MKRHQQLQDLSREHHSALKLALHARRAAMSGDPAQIAASATACCAAFAAELDPHFLIEEHDLLPVLKEHGEHELAHRVAQDHQELRLLAIRLQHPDAPTLHRFGELLSAHVRFEEREVFEAAQEHLDPSTNA